MNLSKLGLLFLCIGIAGSIIYFQEPTYFQNEEIPEEAQIGIALEKAYQESCQHFLGRYSDFTIDRTNPIGFEYHYHPSNEYLFAKKIDEIYLTPIGRLYERYQERCYEVSYHNLELIEHEDEYLIDINEGLTTADQKEIDTFLNKHEDVYFVQHLENKYFGKGTLSATANGKMPVSKTYGYTYGSLFFIAGHTESYTSYADVSLNINGDFSYVEEQNTPKVIIEDLQEFFSLRQKYGIDVVKCSTLPDDRYWTSNGKHPDRFYCSFEHDNVLFIIHVKEVEKTTNGCVTTLKKPLYILVKDIEQADSESMLIAQFPDYQINIESTCIAQEIRMEVNK